MLMWNEGEILWLFYGMSAMFVVYMSDILIFLKKKFSERELVMLDFEIFWHEVAMLFVYVNMYMPGHACHVEFILFFIC